MIRAAEEMQPIDKWPSKPTSWEAKARILKSWYAVVNISLGQWTVGFGFDVAPTGFWINLGPAIIGIERPEADGIDYDNVPDWSRTLWRIVIRKWKLELRIELDLNSWQ